MTHKIAYLKRWTNERIEAKAATKAARKRSADQPDGARPPSYEERAEIELAPVALVPFAEVDFWYLTAPLVWHMPFGSLPAVTVPKGFTTDFASVPSSFWSWMPLTGRYGYPAIIHDWLYWDQGVDRKAADLVFKAALKDLEVGFFRRTILYQAVNWFGGRYWRENTAVKQSGEGRILSRFPGDARITWSVWKRQAGVFV